MRGYSLLALTFSLASPVEAGDFSLQLPIDCDLGQTCFIQNYVDSDPSPDVQDFQCNGLSYDGHKGTDFRLPTLADMAQGVDVLAAAAGVVRGVRDGVPDNGPTAATQGKECGNGVVLRHADGWETQYCHMKSGSLQVKSGQRVTAGTVLGQVGLSGKTQFPHLHLSLRHNGQVVDPFAPSAGSDCGPAAETLWQAQLEYQAGGLLGIGFNAAVPKYTDVKAGSADQSPLPVNAPALVFWAHAFGGRTGDVVTLTVDGPQGRMVDHQVTLPKNQAEFFRAAGKRLTDDTWPKGDYIGTATLTRSGRDISQIVNPMRIE